MLQDLRFAIRNLTRTPAYTFVVILTLAIGLGGNAAIFSVVNAVVLRPLPYPEPQQLVRLTSALRAFGATDTGVAWREALDYAARTDLIAASAPAVAANANVVSEGEAERAEVLLAGARYFETLGVAPHVGRVFNATDAAPGAPPVAIVSERYWRIRLGGATNLDGAVLNIDDEPVTIVGVMPADFEHPGRTLQDDVDIWVPLTTPDAASIDSARSRRVLPGVIARLQPGVTVEDLRARLRDYGADVSARFPTDYPRENGWEPLAVPLSEDVSGNVSSAMYVLLGGVGLVLLIACVNVANLTIARSSERRTEMAIRQSLGAVPRRLLRQTLAESAVLSAAGGLAGLLLAAWGLRAIVALAPGRVPRLHEVGLDATTIAVMVALTLIAALVFALIPVAHARRVSVIDEMRGGNTRGTASAGRTRAQRVLVSTEVALATVLLVVAGLFVRTVSGLLDVPLGFNTNGLVTARVWLPNPTDPRAARYGSPESRAIFQRDLLERLTNQPAVGRVALSNQVPMGGFNPPLFFEIEGRDLAAEGARPVIHNFQVSPSYFEAMEIPVLRGRGLEARDRFGAEPVAVISAAAAQAFWGERDPLGRRLRLSPQWPWLTVVGVVGDVRSRRLTEAAQPMLYRPLEQAPSTTLAVLARPQTISGVGELIAREVRAVDPAIPVYAVRTMDDWIGLAVSQRRFVMRLLLTFGAVALSLALLGLYGVIAYSVSRRTREIGIRIAIGARAADVSRMVLSQGLRLTAVGILVGIAATFSLAEVLQSQLFGVRPADPLTLGVVVGLIGTVAAAASFIPARRASRVDPLTALRAD